MSASAFDFTSGGGRTKRSGGVRIAQDGTETSTAVKEPQARDNISLPAYRKRDRPPTNYSEAVRKKGDGRVLVFASGSSFWTALFCFKKGA